MSDLTLAFSPLVGVAILVAVRAAAILGAPIGPGAPLQNQVDASVAFFGITVVGLFLCFLLLIAAAVLALIGKNKVASAGPPKPERAMEGVKEDIATVKGAHRA